MKAFWRFAIGGGMIVFGVVGIISVLFFEPEQKNPESTGFESFFSVDDEMREPGSEKPAENEKEAEKTPTAEEVAAQKKQYEEDRSHLAEAVAERDVDKCLNIANAEWKQECRDSIYFAMALRDEYIDLCDKIESTEKKRYCRDELLLIAAKSEGDFSSCEEIINGSLRAQCQDAEARKSITNASSIKDCEKIKSKKERDLCFGFFATRAAAQAPEPEIEACAEIVDEGQKRNCRVDVAVEKAVQKADPSLCRELGESEETDDCLNTVRQKQENERMVEIISAGKVEECASIEDDGLQSYCEDQALVRKAFNEHSPGLCQKIRNSLDREKCTEEATLESNRYFFDLATKDNDAKWCRLIIGSEGQSNCESALLKQAVQAE